MSRNITSVSRWRNVFIVAAANTIVAYNVDVHSCHNDISSAVHCIIEQYRTPRSLTGRPTGDCELNEAHQHRCSTVGPLQGLRSDVRMYKYRKNTAVLKVTVSYTLYLLDTAVQWWVLHLHGTATEGVTPIFSWKKLTTFLVIITVSSAVSPLFIFS